MEKLDNGNLKIVAYFLALSIAFFGLLGIGETLKAHAISDGRITLTV